MRGPQSQSLNRQSAFPAPQFRHGGNVHAFTRAQGVALEDVLDFSASINPLGWPPAVRETYRRALSRIVHYPEPYAETLAVALAEYHSLDPAGVLVGNGSTQLIHLLARTLAAQRVLLVAPLFSEHEAAFRLGGAQVEYFYLRPPHFALSLAHLGAALTKCSVSEMFVGLRSQEFPLIGGGERLGYSRWISHGFMGVETMEKLHQLTASKLPGEGVWLAVREFLVEKEALCDLRETRAVVRREHLAVHDGEINCHLIEPTGVNRRVHHQQIGVSLRQTTHGGFAPVRGAIIDEPENTLGAAVGLLFHDLRHQAAKGLKTSRGFTPSHDEPPADIPGGQVLQGSAALVFVLNPHRAPGRGGQTRMAAEASLDTGLFISTDAVLFGAKWRPLPIPRIQIPHTARLLGKVRIAGKIQYLYRQGLMASAARIRQTVLGLIALPSACLACAARSVVERRLNGNPL